MLIVLLLPRTLCSMSETLRGIGGFLVVNNPESKHADSFARRDRHIGNDGDADIC
jgi:hypothetical protein